MYLYLIQLAIHLKLTQHCKSTVHQYKFLKIKINKDGMEVKAQTVQVPSPYRCYDVT